MTRINCIIIAGYTVILGGCSTIKENLANKEVEDTCVELVHSGKLLTSAVTKNGTKVFADSMGGCYMPNGNYFAVNPKRP